jgi:hypothetical protein
MLTVRYGKPVHGIYSKKVKNILLQFAKTYVLLSLMHTQDTS